MYIMIMFRYVNPFKGDHASINFCNFSCQQVYMHATSNVYVYPCRMITIRYFWWLAESCSTCYTISRCGCYFRISRKQEINHDSSLLNSYGKVMLLSYVHRLALKITKPALALHGISCTSRWWQYINVSYNSSVTRGKVQWLTAATTAGLVCCVKLHTVVPT